MKTTKQAIVELGLSSDDVAIINIVRNIQLDAYKAGMTDAANAAGANVMLPIIQRRDNTDGEIIPFDVSPPCA